MVTVTLAKCLFPVSVLCLVVEATRVSDKTVYNVLYSKLRKMRNTITLEDVVQTEMHKNRASIINGMVFPLLNSSVYLRSGKLTGLTGVQILDKVSDSATSVVFSFKFTNVKCTFNTFSVDIIDKEYLGSWESHATDVTFKVTMTVKDCLARATEVVTTSSLDEFKVCASCKKCNLLIQNEDRAKMFYNEIVGNIKLKLVAEIKNVLQKISVKGLVSDCLNNLYGLQDVEFYLRNLI